MKFSLIFIILNMLNPVLFEFSKEADISSWRVLDDGVMGGSSKGQFYINKQGNAIFKGEVSLQNNGGFSSVRYKFNSKEISTYTKMILYVKGDGKKYQFRVKTSSRDYYAYITYFETNSQWQKVIINLEDMYPTFRGRRLNMSNFPKEKIEEISFLFGNKKAENFVLEIKKIEFQ